MKATLLYANPEINADILYFGGFDAPDPFLAIGLGDHRLAVLSDLEFGRAREGTRFTEVLSLTAVNEAAGKRFRTDKPTLVQKIRYLQKEWGITEFEIPRDFPTGLALDLKAARVKITVAAQAIFPNREFKTDLEADYIREGNSASSVGFSVVESLLKASKIGKSGKLKLEGKTLTSERVQFEVESALLEIGARSKSTIVAGGLQACDPHERGHGPLHANELIIVDIFPRISSHGYHGDMTRTYLKGKPSKAQKKLVEAVKAAHQIALDACKPGVAGGSIHKKVNAHFIRNGYETRKDGDTFVGFFHGTGHGLGLEVHEPPRINPDAPRLKKGQVVTIEPGLYYPSVGGCRIEDVVRIIPGGYEMLSNHPYDWVIK